MKDIIKIYKNYGFQVGLISTVYFLIFPINMMLKFVFFKIEYDMSGLCEDMLYITAALIFAMHLKNKNTESINETKFIHSLITLSELVIFILTVIAVVILIAERYF